jgi:hypothetical protein
MNLNGILIGSDDSKRLIDYYTRVFGEPGKPSNVEALLMEGR